MAVVLVATVLVYLAQMENATVLIGTAFVNFWNVKDKNFFDRFCQNDSYAQKR